MQLNTYLRRNRLSAADFARLVGVKPATVYRWSSGDRFPIRHMHLIESLTQGRVTANDFARSRHAAARALSSQY